MAEPVTRVGAGLLLALAACGGSGGAQGPAPPPPPPGLAGTTIMLFPVQSSTRVDIEGELAFWLTDRAHRTDWIGPADLRAVVERTPGWRLNLEALPAGVAEVQGERRLHDPLYGLVRRLAAVTDARLAFIPYARRTADSLGVALELTGVLADAHGGRVLWIGTVRGEGTPPGQPLATASAAEALARALVP